MGQRARPGVDEEALTHPEWEACSPLLPAHQHLTPRPCLLSAPGLSLCPWLPPLPVLPSLACSVVCPVESLSLRLLHSSFTPTCLRTQPHHPITVSCLLQTAVPPGAGQWASPIRWLLAPAQLARGGAASMVRVLSLDSCLIPNRPPCSSAW